MFMGIAASRTRRQSDAIGDRGTVFFGVNLLQSAFSRSGGVCGAAIFWHRQKPCSTIIELELTDPQTNATQ
jgi:hypothetical protein